MLSLVYLLFSMQMYTLRIACASLLATDLPRTIFRTCLTLPRKRIGRKAGQVNPFQVRLLGIVGAKQVATKP